MRAIQEFWITGRTIHSSPEKTVHPNVLNGSGISESRFFALARKTPRYIEWRNQMSIVLERSAEGRPTLWKCFECGKPYTLGWGDYCNACIANMKRHQELLAAIQSRRNQ